MQLERAADLGTVPTPEQSASAQFGDLQLLGYDLPLRTIRPGGTLPLTLYWLASDAPSEDYTISLRLGETTLESAAPVHGSYPTEIWEAGEVVIDRHSPHLHAAHLPGVTRCRFQCQSPSKSWVILCSVKLMLNESNGSGILLWCSIPQI